MEDKMTEDESTRKLFEAARRGAVDEVEAAFDAGADVNAKDEALCTVLHWIAYTGHADIARLLIDKGAKANAKDQWRRTPLHYAAGSGHAGVARLLLDNGADPHAKDEALDTPLVIAAERNHVDIVRMLTISVKRQARPKRRSARRRIARGKRQVGG